MYPRPMRSRAARVALLAALAAALLAAGVPPAFAPPSDVTERVSVTSAEAEASGNSYNPSVSADGRYLAFVSSAENLVPGDDNGYQDVFVRDLVEGTTERVSVASDGSQAVGGDSRFVSISGNGRFVSFNSAATNLVEGDTNGWPDIFVHDMESGATERVSLSCSSAEANNNNVDSHLSFDGRFVSFWSVATNLVPGDTNAQSDIFVRDRMRGTTERVSTATDGTEGAAPANYDHSISGDGRFVVFASEANNLDPDDHHYGMDTFIHDRVLGTTDLLVATPTGSTSPNISVDGRWVVFSSEATELAPPDDNGVADVFVLDRLLQTFERVSVSSEGGEAHGGYSGRPTVSASGRYVTFSSQATDLVPADTNGREDTFVRDRTAGTTRRVNVASDGTEANGNPVDWRNEPVSADGRVIVFDSRASNLVADDTNAAWDVFARRRSYLPYVTAVSPGPTDATTVTVSGFAYCLVSPALNVRATAGNGAEWTTATAQDGSWGDSLVETFSVDVRVPEGYVSVVVEAVGGDFATEGEKAVVPLFVDRTPPVTTSNAAATYLGSASISLSAADTGTLVMDTSWTLDGGAVHTGTSVYTASAGTHVLRYSSRDILGNVEPTKTATFTLNRTTATRLTSTSAVVGYGAACYVRGTLKAGTKALAAKKVLLYTSPDGRTWTYSTPGYTDSAGAFSFKVTPASKTYYRVRFPGVTGYLSSTSNSIYYFPRAYLSAPARSAYIVYANKAFGLSGYLKPRHAAGGRSVKLECYHSEGGRWVLRKTYYAVDFDYSTYTRYTYANVVLPYRGSWKVVASHSDAGHAPTVSSPGWVWAN